MGKISKDAFEHAFIKAVLENEIKKIDKEFMDMSKSRLPKITPEMPIKECNCECCGRRVKVPLYVPEYKTPDLTRIICPFCSKPLRLNISLPGMVQ